MNLNQCHWKSWSMNCCSFQNSSEQYKSINLPYWWLNDWSCIVVAIICWNKSTIYFQIYKVNISHENKKFLHVYILYVCYLVISIAIMLAESTFPFELSVTRTTFHWDIDCKIHQWNLFGFFSYCALHKT